MSRFAARIHAATIMAVCLAVTNSASAQDAPVPPVPPAGVNVIDLGSVGIDDSSMSDTLTLTAGQNIWFKFQLTSGITPATWLNIDTSRSTIDTEIGLYDEWMFKVAEDNFSGGGTSLTSSPASALTFGGGSGQRLGEDGAGWVGGRIDTGWNQVAATWNPTLRAGKYIVAVVGVGADFSQNPNPNYQVSTGFTGSGTIRLRVRTGTVPPTYWNEYNHGGGAGNTPATAQIVEGAGPLETLVTAVGPGELDLFKVRICDPLHFRVAATLTRRAGNAFNGRLYLFDAAGRGVLAINDTLAGDTVLSVPNGINLPGGDYYLGVSSDCGGANGFASVPYDASNRQMWNFTAATNNQPIPPNGTGQAGVMRFMGRLAECHSDSGYYFVRLALTGVCYVPKPVCHGDMNCDGRFDNFDIDPFVQAIVNPGDYMLAYPGCSQCP